LSPKHKYHVNKGDVDKISTHETREGSTTLKTIALGFANLEDTSSLLNSLLVLVFVTTFH